jgi:hypothetical protein
MNMPETLRPALQLNNISEHLVHSELSYIIDLEKEFWKALPYTHTHTHTHTHRERERERERDSERDTLVGNHVFSFPKYLFHVLRNRFSRVTVPAKRNCDISGLPFH